MEKDNDQTVQLSEYKIKKIPQSGTPRVEDNLRVSE